MNEVAESSSDASLSRVQSATRLSEVRNGRKLAVDRSGSIPSRIQRIASLLRRVLVFESRIHISDQMIVVVVAHHDLLDLAVFAHLAPKVLVEGIEVVLQLLWVHARLVVVGRVLVEVGQENGLRVGWFDVFARAAVAVAACADFVVETAVDLVLFCAEDGREVVGHGRVGVMYVLSKWCKRALVVRDCKCAASMVTVCELVLLVSRQEAQGSRCLCQLVCLAGTFQDCTRHLQGTVGLGSRNSIAVTALLSKQEESPGNSPTEMKATYFGSGSSHFIVVAQYQNVLPNRQ